MELVVKNDNVISLTTEKALRKDDNHAWTPADLLNHMLKELETMPVKPESMLLLYKIPNPNPEEVITGFLVSNLAPDAAAGALERVKLMILGAL